MSIDYKKNPLKSSDLKGSFHLSHGNVNRTVQKGEDYGNQRERRTDEEKKSVPAGTFFLLALLEIVVGFMLSLCSDEGDQSVLCLGEGIG